MTAVFTDARCTVCDRKLTVHQDAAGETCDDARCKQRKLTKSLQVKSLQTSNTLAKLTRLRDRAARIAGLDHQPAPVAALPSNDRLLAELPEDRRESFREYLEDSVARAMDSRESRGSAAGEPATRSESGPTDAEQAVMGNGCAVCRGYCCEGGGDHAFLNPAEMRSKLRRQPGIEPADLVAYYLAKLPAISFADSCVFHEQTGCALDREDRSSLCNDYYCSGMSELWHGLSCGGSLRGFVGAMDQERVMRFALIDENGSVDFTDC